MGKRPLLDVLPGVLIGGGVCVDVTASGWVARRHRLESHADGSCRIVGVDEIASGPETTWASARTAAMVKVGAFEAAERRRTREVVS